MQSEFRRVETGPQIKNFSVTPSVHMRENYSLNISRLKENVMIHLNPFTVKGNLCHKLCVDSIAQDQPAFPRNPT